MGMRSSDKDIEREIREGEMYHEAAHRALAEAAVTRWNAAIERGLPRHKPDWSPMIGVALAARYYFLDVFCPGCHQVKQVNLQALKRHERTTLHSLIPSLPTSSAVRSPRAAVVA